MLPGLPPVRKEVEPAAWIFGRLKNIFELMTLLAVSHGHKMQQDSV